MHIYAINIISSSLPGSLQITWQEIMVGIESGLLMFPINILIITIFRSIRPRVVLKHQNGDDGNLRPARVTVPTVLRVCVGLCSGLVCCVLFELHSIFSECLRCCCASFPGDRRSYFFVGQKSQEQDVQYLQTGVDC